MAKRKLEIGAGNSRLSPDWETSDIRPGIADYCVAIEDLPQKFGEEVFDSVYACMVLEHIPKTKQRESLEAIYKILKFGGIVEIIVPNMKYIGELLAAGNEEGIRLAYGDQDYAENTHLYGFFINTLIRDLEQIGFKIIEHTETQQLYVKATK